MLRKQIACAPIELNSEEPGHIVTRAEGQALFEMAHLRPERIGVSLSEEFQLAPEQSTDALIAHHPEAKYFST